MVNQKLPPIDIDIDSFIENLEDSKLSHVNDLKGITKDLLDNKRDFFTSVISHDAIVQDGKKIGRVYSRQEIRNLVKHHLIPQYQHESIINAVTDYLYRIHASG
jgi:hypothetical protein